MNAIKKKQLLEIQQTNSLIQEIRFFCAEKNLDSEFIIERSRKRSQESFSSFRECLRNELVNILKQ